MVKMLSSGKLLLNKFSSGLGITKGDMGILATVAGETG